MMEGHELAADIISQLNDKRKVLMANVAEGQKRNSELVEENRRLLESINRMYVVTLQIQDELSELKALVEDSERPTSARP